MRENDMFPKLGIKKPKGRFTTEKENFSNEIVTWLVHPNRHRKTVLRTEKRRETMSAAFQCELCDEVFIGKPTREFSATVLKPTREISATVLKRVSTKKIWCKLSLETFIDGKEADLCEKCFKEHLAKELWKEFISKETMIGGETDARSAN